MKRIRDWRAAILLPLLLSLLGALQHPTTGTVEVLGHRLGQVDICGVLWPRIGHVQGRHRPSGRPTVHQLVLTGLTGTNGLPLRWEDTADRYGQQVDVERLEARLEPTRVAD